MKYADLVREYTSSVGLDALVLAGSVNGFNSFAASFNPGDQFYYSLIGLDVPTEKEVGIGTFNADGTITRVAAGAPTNFSSGLKTIAAVVGAVWFGNTDAAIAAIQAKDTAQDAQITTINGQLASGLVNSFNGRNGAVLLLSGDVTGALTYTPLRPTNNLSELTNSVTARANLGLATVASSGAYGDLSGRPALAAIATSGSASDLASGTVPVARLSIFTNLAAGAVPASGGGTVNFLRADGSWAAPPGGGGGVTTFNTRSGAVSLLSGDVTTALGFTPEPAIAAGLSTQYWRGDKTWQTLNSAAVGLGNVNNTSDVNKPVSTAQQTALNAKAHIVADRTALAALNTAQAQVAFLQENGREGLFEWNGGANVQTLVTADTAQGIYVPPTGQNGSTGAWVRCYSTTWDIRWFGALANDQAGAGTDALPAINAMLSIYTALSVAANKAFNVRVDFPGFYFVNGLVNLKVPVHFNWPGNTGIGGVVGSSRWRFPAATGGIVVNGPDTTGYTAAAVATTTGAGGSTLERPWLQGAGGVYTTAADGILVRSRCTIIAPYIDGFARQGISCYGDNGNNPMWGNCSGTHILGGRIVNCNGWGIHLKGSDANEVHVFRVDCTLNAGGGVLDESFLGACIVGGLYESNGAGSIVEFPAGGQNYFLRYGQEANGSVTQPGTNNGIWFPMPGSSGGGLPTWVNGGTYRYGASIKTVTGQIFRPYIEGGQPYMDLGQSGICFGGLLGAAGKDYFGAYVNGSFGQVGLNGGFKADTASWMQAVLWFDGTFSQGFPGGLGGQFGGAHYWSSGDGLVTYGYGSVYDWNLLNKNGGRVLSVPTGTTQINFGGTANLNGQTLVSGANNIVNAGGSVVAPVTNAGAITSTGSAGVGYATGAGGTVTQATSRTTAVTLNKICGSITLFSKTTTAGLADVFTVNNSTVAVGDVVNVCVRTATGVYITTIVAVAAGSFKVVVYTPAAVGTAEAPILNFAVLKAVNA